MMFLLILFGCLLVKKGVLGTETTKQIANMLTKYITPTILIMAFQQEFELEQLKLLLVTAVAAFLLILSRIMLNFFLFKKEDNVDRYAAIFSNASFVGIPLVMAVLDYEGVFYLTAYLFVTTVVQWTYGIYTISGDKNLITVKHAFGNPATLGAGFGLILYLLQIELPFIVSETFLSLNSLNTPLAMILLGSYVARSPLLELFTSTTAYKAVFTRLILYPLTGTLILWLLPIDNYLVLMVLSITSSAPSAVNVALFSQIYGRNYEYGAKLVILTTLFSVITMPLLLTLADRLFAS